MVPYSASLAETLSKPFVDFWNKLAEAGPKWLVALAIMVVAWLVSRLLKKMVQRAVGRTSTQGHVNILVARIVSACVLGVGFLIALSELGMSLSGAFAAVGLASVGIGFALQDILSNLFAGIILLMQHPFTIGDQVMLGGQEGVVENVRIRDTQILTYEGERVYIPNKTVFDSPIINFTSTPSLRMDVRVGIRYEEDIARAKRIDMRIMESTVGILTQPEPAVLVEAKADSVELILRFWIGSDRNRRLKIQSDITEWVVRSFQAEGITIPYPIRTIEFYQPPEAEAGAGSGLEKTQAMKIIPPEEGSPAEGAGPGEGTPG